ncbi:hypothetical protein PRIPAC_74358 [Pristionchus pacificus]|uniref:Uncharacterized protein n=1 Tax=Pristionchus pacificus TaxID=54126 RepID=A0A2A6BWG6_PRIPA|nr:hypothetical protein PRIPAC_74358 [Pristionchus pacificus]|eukprot:PDM70218.1 hypothetical protein PRIPAC_45522 [Pristionchus pacificus]
MYFPVILLLIPLISSRSISNETSLDEFDPFPSNETSVTTDTLTTVLQRVANEVEEWKPWLEDKEHEMAEWKDMVDEWRGEHTSAVVYIIIGMFVGLFILIIIIIVRTLATRLRRRKIGQLGGDAHTRKKLMSDDIEDM